MPHLRLLTVPLLALALGLPFAARAGAGVFRYVEKDGTIVYTNVPPPGARKAKRLSGTFTPAPAPQDAPAASRAIPADYEPHIDRAARRYRIPAPLVRAVIHAESAFNRMAVSGKGASGLMQLMPGTAQEMYVKDIFDAGENIEGGVRYLRVLANLYDGDMVKMIAAYNAGPDAVRRYGGAVPPFAETQAYVRKVLQLYYQYKAQERARAAGGKSEAQADGDDARDGAGPRSPRG